MYSQTTCTRAHLYTYTLSKQMYSSSSLYIHFNQTNVLELISIHTLYPNKCTQAHLYTYTLTKQMYSSSSLYIHFNQRNVLELISIHTF